MTDSKALTEERGKTHGRFEDHARITQSMKVSFFDELTKRTQRGQSPLTDQHVESIEMIFHKIGRIVAGDPTFQDHWDDIAGYAHIANQDFEPKVETKPDPHEEALRLYREEVARKNPMRTQVNSEERLVPRMPGVWNEAEAKADDTGE